MSENLPKQPQQSEEVDLGQLFKLIGNAFDRFFKFIANIFNGIFKLLILILGHFYKRFVWYVGAIVVGVVIGSLIERKSTPVYTSNMVLKTKFGSAHQIYENILELNQLATIDRDSVELSKRFDINENDASSLIGFEIKPVLNDNEIVKKFSEFYSKLDSISQLQMTYQKYKDALTVEDVETHSLNVFASKKTVFKKIEIKIIDILSKNKYLEDNLNKNNFILSKQEKFLENQVSVADSLIRQSLKIRINESKKSENSGTSTNIYTAASGSKGLFIDELSVLKMQEEYEKERRSLDSLLIDQRELVSVFSKFSKTGYAVKDWYKSNIYVLPLKLFFALILFFSLLNLGKYLKKLN